jgi:hypothetical protein
MYAAISEEEDDGDGEDDGGGVSKRWARILGRFRAQATALRLAAVRQVHVPATAVRAIRSLAAPTPVRFASPKESEGAYVPFKGLPAHGCEQGPATPRPRMLTEAGTGTCDVRASVEHDVRASVEGQSTGGAPA